MKCTVVIPTYNERENIEGVIDKVLSVGPEFRVLVVDDNSPDGTGQLVEQLSEQDRRIKVLRRAGKFGLGTAYVEGFQAALGARSDFVAQMDADFSHDPEKLREFLQISMEREADFVIGTRYGKGGSIVNWPTKRRILSWCGNLYARIVLGFAISDYLTGFSVIRSEALQRMPYQRLTSQGFVFQVELKHMALRHGLRLVDVPISFVERRTGRSKLTLHIIIEGLLKVLTLRLRGTSSVHEDGTRVAEEEA